MSAATLGSALNVAVGSLQTTQATLSTVSHNISNANTPGFSRQQVITQNVSLNGFGSGVNIQEIRRVANELTLSDLNEKRSALGYATTLNSYLNNVETVFGVPGSSSSPEKLMTKMFNDMSVLANSPDSSSLRVNVVKDAEFVVDTLVSINNQLQATALEADTAINDDIVAINEAIENIHALNSQITNLSIGNASGQSANDLIDERQRQIDIIAEKININVISGDLNSVRLITETGRRLVDEGYVQLERIPSASGSTFQDVGIRTISSNGTPSNSVLNLQINNMTDGSMKALVDIRDTEIANLQAEIQELASTLRDEFNAIHSQGTGIPPQNSFTTGNGFKLSGAAADITLASELNIPAGSSFEVSIVDITTGLPVATTATTTVVPPTPGGSGPITIAGGDTLANVAASIQGNADVGALLTSTTVIDANGDTQIQVSANNPNHAIVFKNNTGNPTGLLGFNNFFEGETLDDLQVRTDIVNNPALVATARMRESDGGVSFVDNRNATALAQLADQNVSFDAAGSIASKSDSLTGYYIGISSNLAVNIRDSSDRLEFSTTVFNDVNQRNANASGVNMDEELANLILYQRTYQASARIISVIDEMLNSLVNSLT